MGLRAVRGIEGEGHAWEWGCFSDDHFARVFAFLVFFVVCFFKQKQLPASHTKLAGALGPGEPGCPKVSLPCLECAERHPPLPWGGGCIDCPSPRHGLFHAAKMGLKGGLFVLGPRIIKCGLWMGLRQEQLAGVLACLLAWEEKQAVS